MFLLLLLNSIHLQVTEVLISTGKTRSPLPIFTFQLFLALQDNNNRHVNTIYKLFGYARPFSIYAGQLNHVYTPQLQPGVGDEKAYNNVELCYSHGRVSDS